MKSIKIIITVLFLFVSSLVAQDDYESTTLLKVGNNMPAFTTTSLSGNTFSSDNLKGKVVLINFWATWCPPCRAEMLLIQKDIYDKLKDENFALLGISRGELRDTVKNFIDKNKYTFPIYLDTNKKIYNLFASKYVPRSFVIGKDGKVKMTTIGFKKEEFEEMIKVIEEELKK